MKPGTSKRPGLVFRDSQWTEIALSAAHPDELCALECPQCHAVVGQLAAVAKTKSWCPVCTHEHTHVFVIAGRPLTLAGNFAIEHGFSQLLIPNCPHCEQEGIKHDPAGEAWLDRDDFVHIEGHELKIPLDEQGLLLIGLSFDLPDAIQELSEQERVARCVIREKLSCVLDDARYFIAGTLPILVQGRTELFKIGTWAEVDAASFNGLLHQARQPTDAGYSGTIANELSPEPGSNGLKVSIRVSSVNELPEFYLDPTEHPLAQDQADGITPQRASAYLLDPPFSEEAEEEAEPLFGDFRVLALAVLSNLLPERSQIEDPLNSWYQVLATPSKADSAIILCSMDEGAYYGAYSAGVGLHPEDLSPTEQELEASPGDEERCTELSIPAGYSPLAPIEAFERLGRILSLLSAGTIETQNCIDFKLSELSEEFLQETEELKHQFDFAESDPDESSPPDPGELEQFFSMFSRMLFTTPELRWDARKELKNAPRIQILQSTKYPKALILRPVNVLGEDSQKDDSSSARVPSVLFIPEDYTEQDQESVLNDLRSAARLAEQHHPPIKSALTRLFQDLPFEQAREELRTIASGEQRGNFHLA